MKRKTLHSPFSILRSPFTWLALLVSVAVAVQSVVVAHRTRVRGIPDDFPAPVAEADVPLLGVNVALEQYDEQELEDALSQIVGGGFTWVRQSFYWSQIELKPGQFDWTVSDRILDALSRHPQTRLIAVLDDRPPVPPVDPDRFAAFAAAFAGRYGSDVDYYQIWDEPNLSARWGGGPVNPAAYADLLAHTSRAIRAADPGARILLAGLAPTTETGPQNLSAVRYLERLYQADAAPYFDIVAGKPYGFDTGPEDRRVDETVLNFSRLILLREVMTEHGDEDKAVWASHWGWNALPPDWTGAPSIWGQTDESTQAARTVAALERTRNEWPWAGALILEHFQPAVPSDDPRWGFALVGLDGMPRPIYNAIADWAAAQPDAAPVGGYPVDNHWASYPADWRVGPLGADVAPPTELEAGSEGTGASFRFDGTRVALTVRRGPYRAFLYVTVDGEPANALPRDEAGRAYVVLYDEEPAVATVPLATGLDPGVHTVEVTAEGGHGQWPLIDWRVGTAPVRDGYAWKLTGLLAAGLALAALLIREARRVDWAALAEGFLTWPEWAQMALVLGSTGLFWAAASLSWGRPAPYPLLPASCLFLSILLLPILAVLFSWRLDLGLSLVAFCAPFYLVPERMAYRALSLPEALVVLCSAAYCVSRTRPERSRRTAYSRSAHLGRSPHLPICQSTDLSMSPMDRAVLVLIAAALIAAIAASDRLVALFELRTVFFFPVLFYVLLRLVRPDDEVWWRIVDGFVLGGVGMALVGLARYALGRNLVLAEGGLPRLQSVYHSPNSVGLYLGRVWPFLVAVALWERRSRRRALYALAVVPVSLSLVLSFSRGALLLALPAALLMMGWRAGGRWRWMALALIAVGALALVPLFRVPRFASLLNLREGTTFFRLELWRSSLRMIRDHRWFGVGPGNFAAAYRTRYVLPAAWEEFNLGHPHSIYLDHWTRLGLLGVLAGLTMQVTFWRRVRRRPRQDPLALGLVGSMAALLAHGLVDNTLFFPDLALGFFLLLAM